MAKTIFAAAIGLMVLFMAGEVRSKTPALDDPLLRADFASEHNAGGTNAVTGLGNGRLTIGVSPWSEVVYLRWPTPSFYDHLRYITKAYGVMGVWSPQDMRHGDDAPSLDWRRYGRPYELHPSLGAKGAIYLNDGTYSWFGDPSWSSSRKYDQDWSSVLCTSISRKDAEVEACQWVDWDQDLLVQDFKINSRAVKKFFYYATIDPFDRHNSYFGQPDSAKAGFATLYLPDQAVILYFLPLKKNASRLTPHLKKKFTPELVDQIYPEGGYFIALGLDGRPDGFQVGADRKGRAVAGDAPPAASEEARKGNLSGSVYFLGQSDSGLCKKISPGQDRVVVLISAGKSAKDAVAVIESGREKGADALRQKAIADWRPMAERVDLPERATPVEKRVARRSILNLFVGRDKQSGAIVASPSRQPAYHFDWPRDGSFYDLSLDLAGFHDAARSHIEFYKRTQRREKLAFGIAWLLGAKPLLYNPAGHWASNIYTDGRPGKLSIIPIEIDETALLIWDLWRHEQYVPESERAVYQKEHLEELTLGAQALMKYVDKKKGWTRKIWEDDNPFPSATLHGAASVLAGLSSASDAGKRWGADPALVEQWRKAAVALREGILVRLDSEKTVEQGGWRGVQWTLFPAPVFESYDDPRAQKLLKSLAEDVAEKAEKQRPGFAYLGEQVFILGIAGARNPEYKALVDKAVKVLVNEVPMPGTDCYGEVTIWIDMPGQGKVAQQRTSIPHLWTGVTSYLAVEALYRPERFASQVPPIPR